MTEAREHGFSRRPKVLDLVGAGGMSEGEARDLAYRLVRRAREEGGKHAPEASAPSSEEVREQRKARRRREP